MSAASWSLGTYWSSSTQSTTAVRRSAAAAPTLLMRSARVAVEIAAVGEARLLVEVEADLDVLVFQLERPDEADECPLGGLQGRFGGVDAVQMQQRDAQRGHQQRRQGAFLWRLDAHGDDAANLRHRDGCG